MNTGCKHLDLQNSFSKKNYAVLIFLIFSFGIIRNHEFFASPSFWAEDATYFFAQSIETGFRSLWAPIVGHYHTIPRVFAMVSTFLPVAWVPSVYAVFSMLLSAFCYSVFFLPGFRWMLCNDAWRFFCCFCFSWMPGTLTANYSLCTLNYPIFCAILFILLEKRDQSFKMSLRKALLLSFLWFSAGQSVAVLPLLFYFYWRAKKEGHALQGYSVAIGALLVSVVLNTIHVMNSSAIHAVKFRGPRDLVSAFWVFFDNFFLKYIYLPIVGVDLTVKVAHWPDGFMIPISFILFWAMHRFWIRNRMLTGFSHSERGALFFFALTPLLIWELIAGVRVSSTLITRPHFYYYNTYAIFTSVVVFSLYVIAISKIRDVKTDQTRDFKWTAAKACLVVFVFFQIQSEFVRPFDRGNMRTFAANWSQKSQEIAAALQARKSGTLTAPTEITDIAARPEGWGGIQVLKIDSK